MNMIQEYKHFTEASLLIGRIHTEIQHLSKTTKCKIDENKTRYYLNFRNSEVSLVFIKSYNNDILFKIHMAYKPKKANTHFIKISYAFIAYLKKNCAHKGVVEQLYKVLPSFRKFVIDDILADLELDSNI